MKTISFSSRYQLPGFGFKGKMNKPAVESSTVNILCLSFRWVAFFILLRHKMAYCVSIKHAVLCACLCYQDCIRTERGEWMCMKHWRCDVVMKDSGSRGSIGPVVVPSTARPPPEYYAVLWSNPGLRCDRPAVYLNPGTAHAFVFWLLSAFYFCGFD